MGERAVRMPGKGGMTLRVKREKKKCEVKLLSATYTKYLEPVQKIFFCTGCQICFGLKTANSGGVAS